MFVCLCFSVCCFVSSFYNHLQEEESASLLLFNGRLDTVNILWRFLMVPWVGLLSVMVVFSDHTHFFFLT